MTDHALVAVPRLTKPDPAHVANTTIDLAYTLTRWLGTTICGRVNVTVADGADALVLFDKVWAAKSFVLDPTAAVSVHDQIRAALADPTNEQICHHPRGRPVSARTPPCRHPGDSGVRCGFCGLMTCITCHLEKAHLKRCPDTEARETRGRR